MSRPRTVRRRFRYSPSCRRAQAAAGLVALLVGLTLGATTASVQAQTGVCSNTPGSGNRIECTEEDTSIADIAIDAFDLTINTAADNDDGIEIIHRGTGNIDVRTSGLTISTTATASTGIEAYHTGSGNIRIESRMDNITTTADSSLSPSYGIDANHNAEATANNTNTGDIYVGTVSTTIQTGGAGQAGSIGISAETRTTGKIEVDISGGSVTTLGDQADGVLVRHAYEGDGTAGDTTLNIHNDASITTSGFGSSAVLITRRTDGKIKTYLRDVTITTTGAGGLGVWALQDNIEDNDLVGDVEVNLLGGVGISTAGGDVHGVRAEHEGQNMDVESHVVITARGRNTIVTSGDSASGLQAYRWPGAGNARIDLQGISIITQGVESYGVSGRHLNENGDVVSGVGDIDIDVKNSTITTNGTTGYGVEGGHDGVGDIDIDVRENSTITTKGSHGYGIYGVHKRHRRHRYRCPKQLRHDGKHRCLQ